MIIKRKSSKERDLRMFRRITENYAISYEPMRRAGFTEEINEIINELHDYPSKLTAMTDDEFEDLQKMQLVKAVLDSEG